MSDEGANTQVGTTSDTTPSQQIGGAAIPPPSVAYVLVADIPSGPEQGRKVALDDLIRLGFDRVADREQVSHAQKAVQVYRSQQIAFTRMDEIRAQWRNLLPSWLELVVRLSVREFFGIGPDGFVIIGGTDIVRPPG